MTDNGNMGEREIREMKLLDLLQVLVRHGRLILVLCGSAALLSIIVSLFLPNIYTATAKVLPPQKEGGGLSALSALLGQSGGLAPLAGGVLGGSSADLYLGILKSRSVADGVIARLGLDRVYRTRTPEETRKALEAAVRMQAGKDGIIAIAADDREPKRAAAIANTFVEELGRKSVQMNLSRAGSERLFLEKRLELVRTDLKNAEEAMKSFQETNKAIKVDSQATATIQGIAQMKAELISKEVQLATLRSYQTDENPQVKLLQSAISRLRGQLGDYEGRGVSDAIPAIGNVPGLGLEYMRRLRELKIQELLFEQLTKQYELAKLSEAKDSSSLQVLDEASVPRKKSKPKRSLIVALSTFTAFFIGVLAAFVREYGERMPPEERARWREMKEGARLHVPWARRKP